MTADDRVLVLMPTARDGERTRNALAGAGLECTVCANLAALCRGIKSGAGVALWSSPGCSDGKFVNSIASVSNVHARSLARVSPSRSCSPAETFTATMPSYQPAA